MTSDSHKAPHSGNLQRHIFDEASWQSRKRKEVSDLFASLWVALTDFGLLERIEAIVTALELSEYRYRKNFAQRISLFEEGVEIGCNELAGFINRKA